MARYQVPAELRVQVSRLLRTRFRSEAAFLAWMAVPRTEWDDMTGEKLARIGAWPRLVEALAQLPIIGEGCGMVWECGQERREARDGTE